MQGLRSVDLGAFVFDDEVALYALKELGGREAVEVAHHSVVVYDFEVGSGECHSKEVVVFLVAPVVGILSGLFVAYECGSS